MIEKLAMRNEEKFLNRYPVHSHRLAGYDYGSEGAYFVTIKTYRMSHYFGSIVQTSHGTSPQQAAELNGDTAIRCSNEDLMPHGETCLGTSGQFTPIGVIAKKNWESISDHFPFVRLDAFQIMPNHMHGILFLDRSKRMGWRPNEFKSLSGTLGTIINLYKGSVSKYAKENLIEFKWHPRYHDTIIRNETSLNNIRNYIVNNPKKWMEKNGKMELYL